VDGQVRLPGYPEIFVIGDAAAFDHDGRPLPGVAQVALQQGRYAARCIAMSIAGAQQPPPFRYFDKGNMAVVGKGFAVLEAGTFQLSGLPAWLAWAAIHIHFLAQSSLRLTVFLQWLWTFLTGQRGSRLIVEPREAEPGGESNGPRGQRELSGSTVV
jgi:NADH dehydrogenase FAD-containing subunit